MPVAASFLPATVIASTTIPPYFVQVAALLVAAAAIAYLAYRVGLVPIVGFLIAGVLIGPYGIGIVRDRAMVDAAAEIGVVLLLFTIGIEFSLEKLARIQRLIFMGGGLQVGLATIGTMLVLLPFGVEWRAALFTGLLVALSSTAIVLKLLGTRGETNSAHGQVGLGLLIFQDLAIILMVMLVPALAGRGSGAWDIVIALAKAAAIIAIVLLVARRIMPHVLESVARACSPEIFLLTVIALCFGTAYLTNLAGVSLSLGAFLAGLLVSESRFSSYALGEILPLQVLFSATFFVSVGMLLDLGFLVSHLPLVIGAIAIVLVVKVATTAASVRALGHPLPVATAAALMLAQVGEFSFVLERTGRPLGLTPAGLGESGSQTFIAATVVLMVATPFLTAFGARSAEKIERKLAVAGHAPAEPEDLQAASDLPEFENHVIVAGYGEAARRLTRVLHGSGVPFLVTTLSPGGALEAEADGLPVLRGDSTRQRTLMLAGIERAKMLVIPDDDPETAHRIAQLARSIAPTVRIVVRTRRMAEVGPLAEEGVDLVVAEELEGIITLFREVLKDFQIPPAEIAAHEDTVRRGGYAVLRGAIADGPVVHCDLDQHCFDSRTIVIHPGAAAAGRPLEALGLEALGIRAARWRRGSERIEGPPPATMLRAGDELVLEGAASAFAQTSSWFRSGSNGTAVVEAPAVAAIATGVARPAPVAEPAVHRDDAKVMSSSQRSGVDMETTIRFVPKVGPEACAHLDMIRPVRPAARGCEECLLLGDTWVHLRVCLTCGHVGCCDSSPNRHARAHWRKSSHPLMRSLEPGETWGWCFVDETAIG